MCSAGVVAVLREGSFLGVVAEREEQAIKARQALIDSAKWSGGTELPDPDKLSQHLTSLSTVDTVVSEKQNVFAPTNARSGPAKPRRGRWSRPSLMRLPMRPASACAIFRSRRNA
jgi:nicotinate dehydrogenase subunit B